MASPELTLIVAATRSMGIGFQGTMPWKGLKREMQYFARVTTRVPASSSQSSWAAKPGTPSPQIPASQEPPQHRHHPLSARQPALSPSGSEIRVPSVEAALRYAQEANSSGGRVFVMGGAQIYEAALRHPAAKRVLLTSIDAEFECDTVFPLMLTGDEVDGWKKRSREELQEWTGEEVDEGGQEEAGIKYEFQMWERSE
ncbi:hypothetical protein TrVFT333_005533 [Trichoderma virens FT-333]|nr:hypothetical protein TrVFT333_005533 [Trichoderma virens FT-333]